MKNRQLPKSKDGFCQLPVFDLMEIASIRADRSVCQAAGLVSRVLFMD